MKVKVSGKNKKFAKMSEKFTNWYLIHKKGTLSIADRIENTVYDLLCHNIDLKTAIRRIRKMVGER